MIESNSPAKGTTSVQRRFCHPQARDKISNWLKAASKEQPRLQDYIHVKDIAVKALGNKTQLHEYLKTMDLLIPSKHVKKFFGEICL